MRKTVLFIALLLITSFGLKAQGDGGGGDFAVELSLTPFNQSEDMLSPTFFKGRYFLGDLFGIGEFGVRLSLGTNMLFFTDQDDRPESVLNLSRLDIRPGVEYYLSTGGQAVPFVGIDFIIATQRSSFDQSVGAPIEGAWDIEPNILRFRGYNTFGFNAVVGSDYYLGGGFFIGTEIGFEFLYFNNLEVKWGDEVRIPKTKTASFQPTFNAAVRVGVSF